MEIGRMASALLANQIVTPVEAGLALGRVGRRGAEAIYFASPAQQISRWTIDRDSASKRIIATY
jgi:hypothetical protein